MAGIPSIAHFVWYGSRLSYLHALAIRSAATHGGFESVRVHHADALESAPHIDTLRELPNVEFLLLDDRMLCDEVAGPRLADLSGELEAPAARSNVARMALLFRDGGVYLDTDTLTIRSFDAVRTRAGAVLGHERIVFPGHVVRSRDPRVKAKAYSMTALRDLFRRLPHGYRAFKRIEPHYHLAVNNAVVGGVAGHAFLGACLEEMVDMPDERRRRRYALGPHLLQALSATWARNDLHCFPPPVFYPLAPEISAHWFRHYPRGVDGIEVVDEATCCVHWYASVRTKKAIETIVDDATIRRLADTQLYSSLARRILDGERIEA